MKKFFGCSLVMIFCYQFSFMATRDDRYFELRIYYPNPGRYDDLARLFHDARFFKKHGIEYIGCWVPVDSSESALYSIVAYPDKSARDASWKSLENDAEWKSIAYPSEEKGKIVARVRSVFMKAADISPLIDPAVMNRNGSFELRTYHCHPGKLANLLTRFRDHTLKLFEKHGMQNLAYWTTLENDGKQPELVYLLGYPGKAAGIKSWIDFRADPQWVSVKADSEKNGPVVDSVTSVLLKQLDLPGR